MSAGTPDGKKERPRSKEEVQLLHSDVLYKNRSDVRAMELAVEEFQGIHNNVLGQLAELQRSIAEMQRNISEMQTELNEERGKRKRAEAKARKLDQQLRYAQKNKFGDKRQNARKDKDREDEADREDEKDKFDGTDGTMSAKSVQENPKEENLVKEKKERDTSDRPEKYDTMTVEGAPVFHPTDDSKVPGSHRRSCPGRHQLQVGRQEACQPEAAPARRRRRACRRGS